MSNAVDDDDWMALHEQGKRRCETCSKIINADDALVFAMPLVPMTIGICSECFKAKAYPFGIVVGLYIDCNGKLNDFAVDMLIDTMIHLGLDFDDFDKEVEAQHKFMAEFEANMKPISLDELALLQKYTS